MAYRAAAAVSVLEGRAASCWRSQLSASPRPHHAAMPLYNQLPEGLDEVDIIIAGGGTAACVVAGRLASADAALSILVIEGGTNNKLPHVTHPVLYPQNLAPATKSAIFYQCNKAPQLADRAPVVPCGGILGGGSSINFMLYFRAQRADFDSWRTPGWSADDMMPYLKRLETYHGPGSAAHHGSSGPVHVSDGGFRVESVQDEFLRAAKAVGYANVTDLHTLDANNAFERPLRYVSPGGRRQDAAHTYLHPLLEDGKHQNLHVLVETHVVRVLFEGKRACGVEVARNAAYRMATQLAASPKQSIRARRLVMVSAGSCGTPLVLERSGIGRRDILQRAGVPVVADLPGVGHDYQDHHLVLMPFKTNLQPGDTMDAFLRGHVTVEEALATGNTMVGWNGVDVASKLRPTEDDIAEMGPAVQARWDADFRDAPNRPLMLMGMLSYYTGNDPPADGQYVTMASYTAYPYSRGHVHITGPEADDPVDFDLGFFTDENDVDLKTLAWSYKKAREIIRRTSFYRGEAAADHPNFPPGSAAACTDVPVHDTPSPVTGDIVYSAADDAAVEQFMRERVNTTWHSLGTAKMAPLEDLGVVDGALDVYGVTGLKVVDLSVAPENVGANTNNTALVIGEKGADIVARELGLVIPPVLC